MKFKSILSIFREPTHAPIAETERLIIRRFTKRDFAPLFAIMCKSEVMYSWGGSFTKGEVKRWLKKQLKRYRRDSYGYFAVPLKNSDKLIGQAGLLKNDLNGEQIVEIGYIFDNNYWGNGYAFEAVKACIHAGFEEFRLDKIYAAVRKNNIPLLAMINKLYMTKLNQTKCVQNFECEMYFLEKNLLCACRDNI